MHTVIYIRNTRWYLFTTTTTNADNLPLPMMYYYKLPCGIDACLSTNLRQRSHHTIRSCSSSQIFSLAAACTFAARVLFRCTIKRAQFPAKFFLHPLQCHILFVSTQHMLYEKLNRLVVITSNVYSLCLHTHRAPTDSTKKPFRSTVVQHNTSD